LHGEFDKTVRQMTEMSHGPKGLGTKKLPKRLGDKNKLILQHFKAIYICGQSMIYASWGEMAIAQKHHCNGLIKKRTLRGRSKAWQWLDPSIEKGSQTRIPRAAWGREGILCGPRCFLGISKLIFTLFILFIGV